MIAEPNRNRRASDDLQDTQRDRQTRNASSTSVHPVVIFWCTVFQERMVQVASTGSLPNILARFLPLTNSFYMNILLINQVSYLTNLEAGSFH